MKIPKIPMTPAEVPQQRINLVPDLPPRPDAFRGVCEMISPMPEKDAPKGSPRNVEYLGAVEWAWGPMNTRFDSYYLNPRGRYWLLWNRWQDDNEWKRPWRWDLYAYALKKGVDAKAAAIYLLHDAWRAEKEEYGLDHFFMIDEEGLLTVSEMKEIAHNVWDEQ